MSSSGINENLQEISQNTLYGASRISFTPRPNVFARAYSTLSTVQYSAGLFCKLGLCGGSGSAFICIITRCHHKEGRAAGMTLKPAIRAFVTSFVAFEKSESGGRQTTHVGQCLERRSARTSSGRRATLRHALWHYACRVPPPARPPVSLPPLTSTSKQLSCPT